MGRGLAVGDLDNDGRAGRADPVAQPAPGLPPQPDRGGPIPASLRLEGAASNRDAVGARVAVVAGGRRRVAWRIGGGSYQSASDPRLHFGLGDAPRVESVEVTWPSGRVDRYADLPAPSGYLLREGRPGPE